MPRNVKKVVKRKKRVARTGMTQKRASLMRLNTRVNALTSTIETKYGRTCRVENQGVPHNNIYVINESLFDTLMGGGNAPDAGMGSRIGDRISVQGVKATFFLEGALGRSKVYFRIMLVRSAKGDTMTKGTLYNGNSINIMIDTVNKERYTVVAQKIVTVMPATRGAAGTVNINGTPSGESFALTGNRILNFWIPGKKFGRNGVVTYENGSNSQVKFYDYRWVVACYDWYGTPALNNVGIINECYSRLYFKDA